jgi:hypothetical protein
MEVNSNILFPELGIIQVVVCHLIRASLTSVSFNHSQSYVGPHPTSDIMIFLFRSFSSCSTDFSHQIAQVVLFLFLFFAFKTVG